MSHTDGPRRAGGPGASYGGLFLLSAAGLVGMVIAMEYGLLACVAAGAGLYLAAAAALGDLPEGEKAIIAP